MSTIHYFQRYSSVENTVTNNTLLLFTRIYAYSTKLASRFLTELTGESVEVGLQITQQQRRVDSIPDGTILQRSFKILIEAKVDAAVDESQLIRHAKTFTDESQKILILLTKAPLGRQELVLREAVRAVAADIVFKAVTYETIWEVAKDLFREHEVEMRSIVDDFHDYCNDTGLFDRSMSLLRVVPCGQSWELNNQYGIYFHPSDRGYTRHAYVGVYHDKAVRSIISVDSVFDVELRDGDLNKQCVDGNATDEFDSRLKAIIAEAKERLGWDISVGHRFFCGPNFETDFRKSSAFGIQGARFVNIAPLVGPATDAGGVARALRGQEWS